MRSRYTSDRTYGTKGTLSRSARSSSGPRQPWAAPGQRWAAASGDLGVGRSGDGLEAPPERGQIESPGSSPIDRPAKLEEFLLDVKRAVRHAPDPPFKPCPVLIHKKSCSGTKTRNRQIAHDVARQDVPQGP